MTFSVMVDGELLLDVVMRIANDGFSFCPNPHFTMDEKIVAFLAVLIY